MKKLTAYETFKVCAILFAIVLLILLFKGCLCNKRDKQEPTKIVTKIDTLWRESKIDTQYVPQLVNVYVPKKVTVHDTLEITELKNVDTTAILKDYFAVAEYADTQHIPQGTIIINDKVTQNRIASRRLLTDLKIPEVTKTVTITEQYPRRVVLYAGGGIVGNQNTPVWGIEGNLGLQFKNLKTYSVGYMINKTGDPLYTFRFALPIKLHR